MTTSNTLNLSQEMTRLFDLQNFAKNKCVSTQIKHKINSLIAQLESLNAEYFQGKGNIYAIASTAINTANLELTLMNQKVRPAQIKKIIKKWKTSFVNLLTMKDMLEEGGHETRWLVAGSNGCYPAFDHTENVLNSFDEGYLYALIGSCDNILKNLPKDAGGKTNTGSPFARILVYFAKEWKRLTGEKPTCGWDELNGQHVGKFYFFLEELIPILREICTLMNMTCSPVFSYANKTMGKFVTQLIEK